MRRSFAVVLVLVVGVGMASGPPSGATPAAQADPKFEQLCALVTQKMTEYGVPGVAFGIVRNGQVTARGFGVTNVDDPQPITADTVFPIASISKTVTATAIMRLVEQGKIDLSAPVRKYLPEFRVQDDAASREVAIWHLLTHTPGWEGQLTAQDRGTETLAFFQETVRDLPQLAPPGAVWSYNNAGFTVAGRVIESVTGRPIHEAIRTLVFEPIGLTRAFTRLEEVATHRFSVAHRSQDGKAVVVRPLTRSTSVTAGGVWMSLNDMLAYARFHLGDGTGRDGARVLTRASLEEMRTSRLRKNSTDDEMGLGWHLRPVGGNTTAAHGGTLGHILLVELVPARNLALAIFTNHSDGWRLIQDVERAALTLLEGMTLPPTQAIGHRGLNETMPEAPILATQPDPAPYLGIYRRPPLTTSYNVRVENGQIMVGDMPVAFYAPDRAVVASGPQRGNPVEFIRRPDKTVGWVRVVGRIARKD
jgi:CubicO group peptidase (beta-lactamase class C family)